MSSICLATVTSDSYFSATLVMIHSFIEHNPWFEGDIVIIHDDLDETHRQCYETGFERIHFLSVSSRLLNRLNPLLPIRDHLKQRQARFYSLEVFRLQDYDKVLFCDGDILFRGSIYDLLTREENLVCCGDGLYYRGGCRDAATFNILYGEDCQKKGVLQKPFNSGFMLVGKALLTDDYYAGLLDWLDVKIWEKFKTTMSDQAVLNLHFTGEYGLARSKYNYLLRYRSDILKAEGTHLTEAKVLHYCGPVKPWLPDLMTPAALQDPGLIQALAFWQAAYIACLKALHFRNVITTIQPNRIAPQE